MEEVEISKDLLKVRNQIEGGKFELSDPKEEIFTQLKELNHRVDELETRMKEERSKIQLQKKKQIIFFLREKEEMTSSQVGEALDISRNRANEYLKQMEDEGIVEGERRGRKKYYRLVEGEEE